MHVSTTGDENNFYFLLFLELVRNVNNKSSQFSVPKRQKVGGGKFENVKAVNRMKKLQTWKKEKQPSKLIIMNTRRTIWYVLFIKCLQTLQLLYQCRKFYLMLSMLKKIRNFPSTSNPIDQKMHFKTINESTRCNNARKIKTANEINNEITRSYHENNRT